MIVLGYKKIILKPWTPEQPGKTKKTKKSVPPKMAQHSFPIL